MAKTLEFFFDYMSPTSFLGWAVVPDLIERTGAELMIIPMCLGGVMKATGNQPPGMVAAKGKYMLQDMARCCKRHGIQIFSTPHFPLMNTRILTGAPIRLEDDPTQQYKLIDAGFKYIWGQPQGGIDTGDEVQFKEAFGSEGFDADRLWELGTADETKAMLRANTEEAVARGTFGAPTFFVGEEMFFGHDRLDYAEEALMA